MACKGFINLAEAISRAIRGDRAKKK